MLKKLQYWTLFVTAVYGVLYGCGCGCCAMPKGCQLFNGIVVALMEDLGG